MSRRVIAALLITGAVSGLLAALIVRPDLHGVLEWSFTGPAGEQVFRQAIDLPRGSRKRVTLDVFAREFARTGQLRLLDGENPLISPGPRCPSGQLHW